MMIDNPRAGLRTPQHREDWQTGRFKFLFQRQSRPVESADEVVTAFRDGVVTRRSNRREDGFTFADKEIGYQGIEPGDLAIHAMDGFAGAIGVADSRGKVSPVLSVLTPRKDTPAHPPFWAYYLRNLAKSGFIESLAKGIRERSTDFRWKDASELLVNYPDLATQKAIADFLDRETARIDQLIEKKQRLAEMLRMKRQETISRLTVKGLNPNASMRDSGISWFGEIPKHWKVQPIKYLVSRSITDGPHVTPVKRDHGVPFISAEAISEGTINFEKKWGYISLEDHKIYSRSYKPKRGDVFVVKLGATAGRVARVETCDDFNIWVPLAAIRPKSELLSKLIYYSLQSSQIGDAYQVLWTYGTQQTLGLRTLSNLRIPIPPEKEIEKIVEKIEAKLPRIEATMNSTGVSINRLREYRAALITAAVTGQIDVSTYGNQGATDRTLDRIEEEMGSG